MAVNSMIEDDLITDPTEKLQVLNDRQSEPIVESFVTETAEAETEETQVESLSRGLATEVLEEFENDEGRPASPEVAESVGSYPPLIATLSKEAYPDITSKKQRQLPTQVRLWEKSYAAALADGKKVERVNKNVVPATMDVSEFLQSLKMANSEAIITEEVEEDPTEASTYIPPALENEAEIEKVAQRLAEGSPQKSIEVGESNSNEIHTKEESMPGDGTSSGFTEISRRKKASEDKNVQIPLIATSKKEVDDKKLTRIPAQASFNQYSALIDSGDSPAKKSKKRKTGSDGTTQQQQQQQQQQSQLPPDKAVRFSNVQPNKGKRKKSQKNLSHGSISQRPPLLAVPLHIVNNLVHKKPFSYVFDGLFWFLVLLLGGPLAAVGVLLLTIYRLFSFVFRLFGIGVISPKKNRDRELGVVVTGCDTGFGRDLAHSLMGEGFVVFCCCLKKESLNNFRGNECAIPLKMDVTNDKDVDAAVEAVTKWLSGKDRRYLHGLVNNAGVGKAGLVDWLTMSDFENMMDINYHGMVRCCKKFLPLFKQQASGRIYSHGRIVNMVSLAGMVKGGGFSVGYEASKHAADVFTTSLRLEAKSFGLKVSSINPSFHKTPLTKDMAADLRDSWDAMTPDKRSQYGEDYFDVSSRQIYMASHFINWDSRNVVDSMKKCLLFKNPPARVIVGSDARYFIILLRMLPTWFLSRVMALNKPLPAIVRK